MKPLAEIRYCTDSVDKLEHEMFDACYNCAPWWNRYPICPQHKRKLTQAGFCKACRRFYDITALGKMRILQ